MKLDQELLKRLNAQGIILKRTDISREQALVLLCQKHIEELLRIWKTELCPSCLLEDFGFTLDWGKLDKFAAGLGRNNPT
jgi:hypothetical protein